MPVIIRSNTNNNTNNFKNFIFIHIPKCGGTTVTKQYTKYITKSDFNNYYINNDHIILSDLLLKEPELKESFIWTLVRNPFAWLYSFYTYKRKEPETSRQAFINEAKSMTFKEFIIWFLNDFPRLSEEDKKKLGIFNNHDLILTGQWCWIWNKKENKLYDNVHIYKLEDYDNCYLKISRKIGVTINKLKENVSVNIKTNDKFNYRQHYDEELREIVYTHYKKDFELFHYEW